MMHYAIALFNINVKESKFQIELRIETFFDHISIEDQIFFHRIYTEIIR